MEIKEKEYIRYIPTNDWVVVIKKVTKIECRMLDNAYYLDDSKEEVYSSHFDDIIKHSKDIIDLIEVGDYVNGCKVTGICGTRWDDKDLHCYCDENWNKDKRCLLMIPAKDIKSVLTHEQFEANAYVLEKER